MSSRLLPLSQLMARGRPGGQPVATRGESLVDWGHFAGDVASLAGVLASHGSGRWLVYSDDAYAFTVALLAAWQTGSVVVSAPNGQPGTLAELAVGTLGLVSDDRVIPGVPNVIVPTRNDVLPWDCRSWSTLDRDAVRLQLFTSGTAGHGKPILKTIAHLEDEVKGLERQWGTLLGDRQMFATVSHQHIYGLLFRVLWPLCTGRVFRADKHLLPEELAGELTRAGGGALVTTPAHLRRLKGLVVLPALAGRCHPVFSSGGPLDETTADAVAKGLGAAPVEVFGSTETGGVAWRQQSCQFDRLAWTPFPDVTVALTEDGHLRVRSPFVSADDRTFTMADMASLLPDGRFVHAGRSDRVVKIGDKRLSLPAMEERLRKHRWVAEAALVLLERAMETRVGAVVVLNPEAADVLRRDGRRTLSLTLSQWLQPYWDRVLLPRAWRYVERLPEDGQGKLTTDNLRRLFAAAPETPTATPYFIAEAVGSRMLERVFRVPERLECMEGHFPNFPVVPGFVQIKWVMEAARVMAGADVEIRRLEALKFRRLLRPGDMFRLVAEMSPDGAQMTFRLFNDQTVFSSGRCLLTTAFPESL